jgi:hypothetical protein
MARKGAGPASVATDSEAPIDRLGGAINQPDTTTSRTAQALPAPVDPLAIPTFLRREKQAAAVELRRDLVGEIHSAHARAESACRLVVECAIEAGEMLIEAKAKHGRHGQWATWLAANIKFSDRTARAYMQMAKLPVEKRQRVADLPLRDALSAIRGREKRIADAEEREARVSRPAQIATVIDGEVVFGGEAVSGVTPAPPAMPPATREEIADDLIGQLNQAAHELRDRIGVDDLRQAFDRRFRAEAANGFASGQFGDLGQFLRTLSDRARAGTKRERIGAARQILKALGVTMTARRRFSDRRSASARAFDHGGHRFRAHFGIFPDGNIGEVFLDSARPNSAIDALAADAAILISLLLQFGASPAEIGHALRRNPNSSPASLIGGG